MSATKTPRNTHGQEKTHGEALNESGMQALVVDQTQTRYRTSVGRRDCLGRWSIDGSGDRQRGWHR